MIDAVTEVTYEVWEQGRTWIGLPGSPKLKWDTPTRRHPGNRGLPKKAAEMIAADYNEDQKYLDRHNELPTKRYLVVEATATTSFKVVATPVST
jgi:hypothetical protein